MFKWRMKRISSRRRSSFSGVKTCHLHFHVFERVTGINFMSLLSCLSPRFITSWRSSLKQSANLRPVSPMAAGHLRHKIQKIRKDRTQISLSLQGTSPRGVINTQEKRASILFSVFRCAIYTVCQVYTTVKVKPLLVPEFSNFFFLRLTSPIMVVWEGCQILFVYSISFRPFSDWSLFLFYLASFSLHLCSHAIVSTFIRSDN